ncbi:GNAT family N-acetyltransferase [Xylanimonas protaetiae]|uniref:N-acetyltransferase n=1 Tax=Xylanimonas protaetiae TaxID=2509457 RepID=A0A4P6F1L3_9MICO|nr:GNAT family N-acetyltransferase [Xylanimonas protaetiae]QAY69680.1 N-acetyltransferase [Xylanimonas protaetiae]
MTHPTASADQSPVCVVVRLPEQSRYEAHHPESDRVMGWLNFRVEGDVVVIPQTVTVPEFRGRGVAAMLARQALEDAIDDGKKVDALCWYVAEFIERNPRYYSLQV